MTLRVVQWTTGIVGAAAVRAIVVHPELEIVGAYTFSPAERGITTVEHAVR